MTTTQLQPHPPPPLYGMHQGELCIKPHSQQAILPNSGGQLSPGSTVFRTKPVIVFDLDLESEEKQLPQTIPTVKAQKAPEKVQNKAANGAKKVINEEQQNQKRVMLQKGIEGSDRSRVILLIYRKNFSDAKIYFKKLILCHFSMQLPFFLLYVRQSRRDLRNTINLQKNVL